MQDNVRPLRERGGDSEKITINLGYVDLGRIDLLVQDGFYSNRTDFIRTAIRNQIATHAPEVARSIERQTLEVGLRDFAAAELEAAARPRRDDARPRARPRPHRPRRHPRARRGHHRIADRARCVAGEPGRQVGPRRTHPLAPSPGKDRPMSIDIVAALRRATDATRALDVAEATRLIQQALGIRSADAEASAEPQARRAEPEVEDAEIVAPPRRPDRRARRRPLARSCARCARDARRPRTCARCTGRVPRRSLPLPDGARFEARTYTGAAGARGYRLYVPASRRAPRPRPRRDAARLHPDARRLRRRHRHERARRGARPPRRLSRPDRGRQPERLLELVPPGATRPAAPASRRSSPA